MRNIQIFPSCIWLSRSLLVGFYECIDIGKLHDRWILIISLSCFSIPFSRSNAKGNNLIGIFQTCHHGALRAKINANDTKFGYILLWISGIKRFLTFTPLFSFVIGTFRLPQIPTTTIGIRQHLHLINR